MIYLLLFLFAVTNSFLVYANEKTRFYFERISVNAVILCIFFLIALRYGFGDYFSYFDIYKKINSISNFGLFLYDVPGRVPTESGFALFIFLQKNIINHFPTFVFIFSIFCLGITFHSISKLSPFLMLSILVYLTEYFWVHTGLMRASTAMGFVFYSTLFVYKRKLFNFLLCILIATWFHSFAVIGFFLYFIPYFAKPFLMWTILIGSVLISANGGIGLLMGNLLSDSGIAGIGGTSRIVIYLTSKYVHGYKTFGLTFISHIIFSVLSLIFFKKLSEKWKYNTILIPMYIYGSSLFFLLNDYGILAGRTQDLLCTPSIIVILPSFLLIFKKKERIVPYLLIVIYCVIFFASQLINSSNSSSEYQSILQFI